MIQKKCKQCNKDFLATQNKIKFCSCGCYHKSHSKEYPKCRECSKKLSDFKSKICLKCYNHSPEFIERNRKICKIPRNHKWGPMPQSVKDKIRIANAGRIVTQEHRDKISKTLMGRPTGRTGAKAPNWKGGVTKLRHKEWQSAESRNWRLSVFERDKYTCQMPRCNKSGCILNAHHIEKYSENKEKRLDINNGITLCFDCHNKTKHKEKLFEEVFRQIIVLSRG